MFSNLIISVEPPILKLLVNFSKLSICIYLHLPYKHWSQSLCRLIKLNEKEKEKERERTCQVHI